MFIHVKRLLLQMDNFVPGVILDFHSAAAVIYLPPQPSFFQPNP